MRSGATANLYVFALASLWFGACTPPARPPTAASAAAAPPPPLYEEEIKPVQRPDIGITDLTEVPSADKRTVTVSGVLVNRGAGATRQVYVHVEALDRAGAVLVSADSEPAAEVIGPGAIGRFSVTFENRADVDRYHIEAISR